MRRDVGDGNCANWPVRDGATTAYRAISHEHPQPISQGSRRGFLGRTQGSPASRVEPAPDTLKVANAEVLTVVLAGEVWS